MLTVNKIFLQYRAGYYTREETVSRLLAEIFKSPRYYNLEYLSEDEISNFLLWILPHVSRLLDSYDEKTSSFITYFTSAIRLRVKGWKRQCIKDTVLQNVLDTYHYKESNYDECIVSEQSFSYATDKKIDINLKTPLSKRQTLTILVLSLRSIFTLNQNIIDTIPSLTGISREKFEQYIHTIKEKMKGKKQNYDELERRINRDYILTQQYEVELQNIKPDTAHYETLKRKYFFYRERLYKLRKMRVKCKLIPSNRLIEETLNIPIGGTRRIIANAEKYINQIQQLLDPKKD